MDTRGLPEYQASFAQGRVPSRRFNWNRKLRQTGDPPSGALIACEAWGGVEPTVHMMEMIPIGSSDMEITVGLLLNHALSRGVLPRIVLPHQSSSLLEHFRFLVINAISCYKLYAVRRANHRF